jgi:hypothetical protein
MTLQNVEIFTVFSVSVNTRFIVLLQIPFWQHVVTLQNAENFTVFFGGFLPGKPRGFKLKVFIEKFKFAPRKRAGHGTCQQTIAT